MDCLLQVFGIRQNRADIRWMVPAGQFDTVGGAQPRERTLEAMEQVCRGMSCGTKGTALAAAWTWCSPIDEFFAHTCCRQ